MGVSIADRERSRQHRATGQHRAGEEANAPPRRETTDMVTTAVADARRLLDAMRRLADRMAEDPGKSPSDGQTVGEIMRRLTVRPPDGQAGPAPHEGRAVSYTARRRVEAGRTWLDGRRIRGEERKAPKVYGAPDGTLRRGKYFRDRSWIETTTKPGA
jgi:hypothetical protein